ncbi:aminopeptidase P family N-terminal domain-containing protein [Vibrio viridaestus]|uniref:M24 family metallopeptidase n=1 Tax=Vibrio viridaestus TaxID=2487322 RepID=A0A3N9TDR0_9VIBR|nr:aminopeptidase P family N-terminal domain-containing protein [Vibrio viridaestus]RQW62331.1 M24 family metallopeptidase [Vibrio viridaestus]
MDTNLEVRNGAKSRAVFTTSEMVSRLNNARKLMTSHRLDGMILSSFESISYFSDFTIDTTLSSPSLLLILPDKSLLISPQETGGHSYRNSFCESRLYTSSEHLQYYVQHYLSSAKKIGIESWSISDGLKNFLSAKVPALKRALCVEQALHELKANKSEEEMSLYIRAESIAFRGLNEGISAMCEGSSELELALNIRNLLIKEAASFFPQLDVSRSYCLVQSSLNTDSSIAPASTRPLVQGDLINITVCPVLGHYRYPITRSVLLGSPKQPEYAACLQRAFEKAKNSLNRECDKDILITHMTDELTRCIGCKENISVQISSLDACRERSTMTKQTLDQDKIVHVTIEISKQAHDQYLNTYRLSQPILIA